MKIVLIFATLASFASSAAFASLGSGSDSVEKDRQVLHGSKRVMSHQSYQVHEIESNGVTVREYLTNNGTVFGVAWNGAGEPDLSLLFGSYFQEYKNAEPQAKRHGRHALRIQSQNISVEKSGHMRAIQGKAYISSLIPAGVSVSDIQ